MKGINPAQFIKRFGGQHGKAAGQKYGMQPHGRGAMPPPRPSGDNSTAPTMNTFGLNSSGRPSDASAPTPNTDAQNLG
jgi:hypothetical protein